MKKIYIDNFQIHDNVLQNQIYVSPQIIGLEMADIRLATIERPNQDGAFIPSQLYGARVITMRGFVSGLGNISNYRLKRRQLAAACGIKRVNGETVAPVLKFTTMDDLELQVEVYTRKFELPDEFLAFGKWKIDFAAADPYLYSQELHSELIYIFSGGGWALPLDMTAGGGTDSFAMSEGASSISSVQNIGNADASPIIYIYGPAENPTIDNLTTGEQLSITYDILVNDYVRIDVAKRTAIHVSGSTVTNIRQYVGGDFIKLAPGDNELKLSVADYNAAGYVRIDWRDSYIAI